MEKENKKNEIVEYSRMEKENVDKIANLFKLKHDQEENTINNILKMMREPHKN